jgi:hypothetical protein
MCNMHSSSIVASRNEIAPVDRDRRCLVLSAQAGHRQRYHFVMTFAFDPTTRHPEWLNP